MVMERRKAQRFKAEIYFNFKSGFIFLREETPMFLVKDISKGGLSFIYSRPLSFGQKLLLKVYLIMYRKAVKIKAIVKKSQKFDNDKYRIGLEFVKISPEIQKNLDPRVYMSYQVSAKEY